ncbi:MAG: NAD(P)-dependent alcohol dehydrogenase [Nocardioides sp.]
MQAIVQRRYGEVADLRLEDLPDPVPAADEVLVRVAAAAVHPDVWHVVVGKPRVLRLMGSGLRRPKRVVPGIDMAGVVEQVGSAVHAFEPGDRVFGEVTPGLQWVNGGAYAELVSVRADLLAAVPDGVDLVEASTVPTVGLIVLQNLLPVPALRPGARVLVNGAAGGVGGMAVQILKSRGAEVTGVDHRDKLDVVTRLGAGHVIDYTSTDYTRDPTTRYDLVFDIPGNHGFSEVRRVLEPSGLYVVIGHDGFGTANDWWGSIPHVLAPLLRVPFTRQVPRPSFAATPKGQWMQALADLLAQGHLTPVVDRVYPLAEASAALAYLASGRARGRVVLAVPGT